MKQIRSPNARTPNSLIILFISILLFVHVSHAQLTSLQQAINCTNSEAPTNPACWNDLSIPSWLSQFSDSNATCITLKITPAPVYSWSYCLQSVAQHYGYLLNFPLSPSSPDPNALTVEETQRYRYAFLALSQLDGVFVHEWMDEMNSNAIAGSSDVSAILDSLDPDRRTAFVGYELYQALMLGLPFFYAYNGTGIPQDFSLEDVSGLFLEMAGQVSLPLSILPVPDSFKGVVPSSALPAEFSNLTLALQSGVQDSIDTIDRDVDTFRNVTANGAFVSTRQWSVPPELDFVSRTLNTYLVSSILAQQNWTVFALVGIDVAALSQTTGSLPRWARDNCPTCTPPVNFGCTAYDSHSQCGRWWYSPDLNSSFTLVQTGNPTADPTPLITNIFTHGWTTGGLLFQNAAICDEPPSLKATVADIPPRGRPASPVTDYIDSWFWKLMGSAPVATTPPLNIVLSDAFNRYIESLPKVVRHPDRRLFEVSEGRIDFSCLSQLDLRVGWNWTGIVAWNLARGGKGEV